MGGASSLIHSYLNKETCWAGAYDFANGCNLVTDSGAIIGDSF
jgi:hypothetical protein